MPAAVPSPPRPDGAQPGPRVAVTLTQLWHRVPGGTATSVLELVDALAARSDVRLAGVGARGVPSTSVTLPTSVPVATLPLPATVLYDSWDRLGRPAVEPVVTSVLGGVDVVHLTVPMGPPRSRAALVATVHDLFPLSRPEWFTRRGVRLMAPALRRIRDHADAVVVPSRSVAEDCRRHGFDPDRLHVVPWGTRPVTAPADGGASVRRRFGLAGPYVLFVGTVEPRKGLPVLADALARIGRADLTLVVAGPSGWGPETAQHLAAVPGPIVRTGFVGEDELLALRAGAAACCLPSWAEGFGLPALEALAAGTPLVTSSGTALAEVAGDAAVLAPPGRADLLADALRSVLDDDALADRLREAGPKRAAGFRWEDTAAAYAEVYRLAAGAGGRRP
ncbi:glycosyltransferase family 4 protein [Dermatobacter hominis]|uniref:glycosyltransferase family 4 protein n=1 Tax=Dermatobacter hominis TaxID=2884263 RepID=UPI001D0FDD09|nr:glycosyltransferase family 1 protein [Dermatobacter hominis]UDY35594.1 glycosyltransferase family 4 protein [Dermatobacter hominis]